MDSVTEWKQTEEEMYSREEEQKEDINLLHKRIVKTVYQSIFQRFTFWLQCMCTLTSLSY